jgi:methyltransferase (TIGR00027 family)
MEAGKPSRTARVAGFHRAAHQLLEQGRIFADPLAVPVLGEDPITLALRAEDRPAGRPMRIFIAVRHRFAEDALARAVERGASQVVVLGAGLDTAACRSPWGERVRFFEVDHPSTQAWKRERLAQAGIAVPGWLTFAPVDFERETLAGGLAAAGFDPSRETFFTWLGVVPYLTPEAVWNTLRFIGGLTGGAQVVFDYADPPEALSPEAHAAHLRRAARVAELGERWLTYFEAGELREKLLATGFTEVEDLGPRQIAERYLAGRGNGADRGGHVVRAGHQH